LIRDNSPFAYRNRVCQQRVAAEFAYGETLRVSYSDRWPCGKIHRTWRKAVNTFNCWAVVLIAVSLLPNVAASADPAKGAYEKGKA
jgi:hypothetical protein